MKNTKNKKTKTTTQPKPPKSKNSDKHPQFIDPPKPKKPVRKKKPKIHPEFSLPRNLTTLNASEAISTHIINKIIIDAKHQSLLRHLEKETPNYVYTFTKQILSNLTTIAHINYGTDSNDLINKTDILCPVNPLRERNEATLTYIQKRRITKFPRLVNNTNTLTNNGTSNNKEDIQDIIIDENINNDNKDKDINDDNKSLKLNAKENNTSETNREVISYKWDKAILNMESIQDIEGFEEYIEDENINKLREEAIKNAQQKVVENITENKRHRFWMSVLERYRERMEKKRRLRNIDSEKFTFDSNGTIMNVKKIPLDKLSNDFCESNSIIGYSNDLSKEKDDNKKKKIIKKKKKNNNNTNKSKDDKDSKTPDSLIAEGKNNINNDDKKEEVVIYNRQNLFGGQNNNTLLPLINNDNSIGSKTRLRKYCIPSGNNFDLITPETGVIIKNERDEKIGSFDFMNRFNKYSFKDYNKLLFEYANNVNNIKTKYIKNIYRIGSSNNLNFNNTSSNIKINDNSITNIKNINEVQSNSNLAVPFLNSNDSNNSILNFSARNKIPYYKNHSHNKSNYLFPSRSENSIKLNANYDTSKSNVHSKLIRTIDSIILDNDNDNNNDNNNDNINNILSNNKSVDNINQIDIFKSKDRKIIFTTQGKNYLSKGKKETDKSMNNNTNTREIDYFFRRIYRDNWGNDFSKKKFDANVVANNTSIPKIKHSKGKSFDECSPRERSKHFYARKTKKKDDLWNS